MAVQIPTAIPIGMYRKGQVIIGVPSMLGPNINCIRGTGREANCKVQFNPGIWTQRGDYKLSPTALQIVATRAINVGEELLMDYGSKTFWDHLKIVCADCLKDEPTANNDMIGCEGVCGNRYFHMQCLAPALTVVPAGAWFCDQCMHDAMKLDEDEVDQVDEGVLRVRRLMMSRKVTVTMASHYLSDASRIKHSSRLKQWALGEDNECVDLLECIQMSHLHALDTNLRHRSQTRA